VKTADASTSRFLILMPATRRQRQICQTAAAAAAFSMVADIRLMPLLLYAASAARAADARADRRERRSAARVDGARYANTVVACCRDDRYAAFVTPAAKRPHVAHAALRASARVFYKRSLFRLMLLPFSFLSFVFMILPSRCHRFSPLFFAASCHIADCVARRFSPPVYFAAPPFHAFRFTPRVTFTISPCFRFL